MKKTIMGIIIFICSICVGGYAGSVLNAKDVEYVDETNQISSLEDSILELYDISNISKYDVYETGTISKYFSYSTSYTITINLSRNYTEEDDAFFVLTSIQNNRGAVYIKGESFVNSLRVLGNSVSFGAANGAGTSAGNDTFTYNYAIVRRQSGGLVNE